MSKDRENPKTDHEKTLYQNATDEKGAQKTEHYNQYGKKDDDDRKVRKSKKDN
ncbi:hypothetical protein [Winogradskyella bathintestinalis]|uniref:Uncharacterized protein n=1 Tax=Winogradskyella bathintestinalis TaxID=3035208 RepID=A0ABT7ZU76_9FLAO|nr:hypothetical protein [Winogradskyella bathintestinalis]MDN3492567.1 hypothetical protein [Winogradskyella bathintestinalis]